ncbi:DinB family protein [Aneurinibacillus tyrosinisolvens]|uniref:DinB family protein n=1 Tax=Aneurinibacillus tyrosinisolvens TaxID=1443435 RepID=UPI00063F17BB|nr:DinB family protein [Aneurinibacillus tyrosinisolvens]
MLNINEFISYFEGIRKRTLNYAKTIPNSLIDWRIKEDKFSFGDIIRHLGATELMFFQAVKKNEWYYVGHGEEKGRTLEGTMNYLNECHTIVMTGLQDLTESDLRKKIKTFSGYEVSAWRMFMAMAEHEIHHRGQISSYLQMNDITPPQIFGQKIEQIHHFHDNKLD